MIIFAEKATGKVLYQTATFDTADHESMIEVEWTNNVERLGVARDDVEIVVLNDLDPVEGAMAQRALVEEIELGPKPKQVPPRPAASEEPPTVDSPSPPRYNPDADRLVFKGARARPPLPDAVQKQRGAGARLGTLRKKGAAAMTPAERNEALDLMLLERTPPHELLAGG